MTYPYPIPAGVNNTNVAYFFANSTNRLGVFIKQVNDLSLISVDYSQLTPGVTLASVESFIVDQGGNPPLVVSNPGIDVPTTTVLTFLLSNGLAGVQYTLSIVMNLTDSTTRTDILTVNIPSTGDDCCAGAQAVLASPIPFPNVSVISPDGSVYYNQVPRWFLSSSPPINPNVMDQWYNPSTNVYYQYVTDGTTAQWIINQSLLSPNIIIQFNTLINDFFAALPTTLPGSAGQLWWDGGVLARS